MPKTFEEIGSEIESLQATAGSLLERLTSTSSGDDIKAVQTEMQAVQGELATLTAERDARLREEEMNGVKAQIQSFESALRDLQESSRITSSDFQLAGGVPFQGEKSIYAKGERSLFGDIRAARGGDQKAVQRLSDAIKAQYEAEGKAMTEGTDADGGFLVRPQLMAGLLQTPERPPSITALIPTVRVTTDSVEFVSVSSGLVAGWAAELAEKPQGQLSFSQFTASVFTAAGLSVASNQLLADSSVDQIIYRELRKRYNNVIAKAIVNGTGSGQPLGLLQTPGRNVITYDSTADGAFTVPGLLKKILDAITAVQENNLSEPTHIVLRSSTWNAIISDADSKGIFTLGSDGLSRARTAADSLPNRSLYGYPVVLENNIPQNLGTGTDETRVIVGDFSEALMLEREDFSIDKSEHVYFTSNQTVFRGEGRVGFTAARYPKAFSTVEGDNLAGL